MEIEAKFIIPAPEAFQRLQTIRDLADFSLTASTVKIVHDTYLDTAERNILAAGYACRQRTLANSIFITLKGLGHAGGAIHRREELEVEIAADCSSPNAAAPEAWPEGTVREQVLRWIGDAPLLPLFTLSQTRIVRQIQQGERTVAELSLDDVQLMVGPQEQAYLELEVELMPEGTEEDLVILTDHLQEIWGLQPEPRSKFARALDFVQTYRESPSNSQQALLTPPEHAVLEHIAKRDDMYERRAKAILGLHQGMTQTEAGEHAGLSERRVRHWLAQFRDRRLAIFPDRVLQEDFPLSEPAPTTEDKEARPTPKPEPPPRPLMQPLSLDTLLEHYNVDQAYANTVANHALVLFDALASIHNLPAEMRIVLETAALLHSVGAERDPARPHIAGYKILREHPPVALAPHERTAVALTALLHLKPIKAKQLKKVKAKPEFAQLPTSAQHEVLTLAALVRVAAALDSQQTGTTAVTRCETGDAIVVCEVEGPVAALDAQQASIKSDLWKRLFGVELVFNPPPTDIAKLMTSLLRAAPAPGPQPPLVLPEAPGLDPDDGMMEAARKTFLFHFQRMLFYEPGTRLGEDIEELHDMRVATRRMRAAARVFQDYLDKKQMKPFIKGMRRTGRALGAVRDLDVFWEKTEQHLQSLPPDQQINLSPLHAAWEAERARAREQMSIYLDSKRYQQFKESFAVFLQKPGTDKQPRLSPKGEPVPYRLRHVVPIVITQRLAAVRAYDEWIGHPDTPLSHYHQLRIASKALRYTLEYFEEVLGADAKTAIKQIKALQDHLGDLQDAVVASNLLRDFLVWGTWGHEAGDTESQMIWPEAPVIAPGVAAYLTTRQVELQEKLQTFPELWQSFQSAEFNHLIASAIAVL